MNNPEYVKIGDRKYKINTDFRVAIECDSIARDTTIRDEERALAIIYMLYGDDGLNATNDYEELLKLAQKYLCCGKELTKDKHNKDEKPDMDFEEDIAYIEASFMSDYNIDLTNKKMHWWTFFNLLNGLSNSEFGNCCVLNRVRNLRTYDVSKIKDRKEREKIIEAQKNVELKRYKKENHLTKEQEQSMMKLNQLLK